MSSDVAQRPLFAEDRGHPLQYLRELTQNSIQAIQQTPEGTGGK
jgi:hypothetical protein